VIKEDFQRFPLDNPTNNDRRKRKGSNSYMTSVVVVLGFPILRLVRLLVAITTAVAWLLSVLRRSVAFILVDLGDLCPPWSPTLLVVVVVGGGFVGVAIVVGSILRFLNLLLLVL